MFLEFTVSSAVLDKSATRWNLTIDSDWLSLAKNDPKGNNRNWYCSYACALDIRAYGYLYPWRPEFGPATHFQWKMATEGFRRFAAMRAATATIRNDLSRVQRRANQHGYKMPGLTFSGQKLDQQLIIPDGFSWLNNTRNREKKKKNCRFCRRALLQNKLDACSSACNDPPPGSERPATTTTASAHKSFVASAQ